MTGIDEALGTMPCGTGHLSAAASPAPLGDDVFASVLEHMPNGVAYCRMLFEDGRPCDFVYLYANPMFRSQTGLGEVRGKRVSEVIPGIRESDPRLFEIYGRVALGGPPERFEIFVQGLRQWFSVQVFCPKPEHFVAVFDVVTERKQREAELIRSQQRLALAHRSSGSGAWDWDVQTGALTWSDEFFRLFGLDPATTEASFDVWRTALHPDDLARAEARIGDALRDRSSLASEYRIVLPQGEERWIGAYGDVLVDAQGQAVGMVGICLDITDRKRAETLLRTRLRMSELSQSGTLDELLQAALDGAEEVTGSKIGFFHSVEPDQEQLTLQTWSTNTLARMCTAEGRGQHYAISRAGVWADCVRARAPVIHNDYAAVAQPGGLPEGHASVTRELAVPIVRANKVTGIMGVGNKATDYLPKDVDALETIAGMAQDLVDRRRAEEALRSERAILQQIMVNSPVGIAVVHRSGRITLANPAAEAMLGLTRHELSERGYDAREWKHTDLAGDPLPREQLPAARVLATGEPVFEVEHGIEWPDGRRVLLSVNAAPLFDAAGAVDGVVATLSDITEASRLEEARRQTQKLEALGTLAGGVAHDFNNLITSIMGNVELARQDVDAAHPAQVSLEEIRRATHRARDLVQRILAFGRRRAVERKVISLVPVVQEAAGLLRVALPAGMSLDVACAPDVPAVLADATQVGQVLLNLGSNALQATQGLARPGVVEVRLQAHERLAGRAQNDGFGVAAGDLRPGRYACLSVRDNGAGMDARTLAHMFEPFFTTKTVDKGTGLGLAIVHGIVQEHEGSIEIRSVPGEGSCFRIYFPAAQAAEQAVGAVVPAAPPTRGQGRHVFYLDDDEAIVFLMTRLLERQGYRVTGFTDPLAALAAMRADPDRFDLAVTDYNMPGMSGLDVARALKAIRPGLPVAVVTGYITDALRQEGPDAGVSELIYKPDSIEDLCAAVARLASAHGADDEPTRGIAAKTGG